MTSACKLFGARLGALGGAASEGALDRSGTLASLGLGVIYQPSLETLLDPVSTIQGVADGTSYVPVDAARDFDGATDRLDWASISALSAVPYSIALWARATALDHTGRLWSTLQSSGGLTGPFWAVTSAGALQFSTTNDGGTNLSRTSDAGTVVVGVWQHLIATVDGTNTEAGVKLYADGVSVATGGTTGTGTPRTAAHEWSLGGLSTADAFNFAGLMRDVRIWSRVLTPLEADNLWLTTIRG